MSRHNSSSINSYSSSTGKSKEKLMRNITLQKRGGAPGSLRRAANLLLASTSLMLVDQAQADHHVGDYLESNGQFGDIIGETVIGLENKKWIVVSPDSYEYSNTENWIQMSKKSTAEGFFDDGLTYLFKNESGLVNIRPRHIHFEVKTLTAEVETCDLRFYSVDEVIVPEEGAEEAQEEQKEEDKKTTEEEVTSAPAGPNEEYVKVEFSDVALFRLGYFNYAKLNTESMVKQFKEDEWYVIDLIFDWQEQRASIYINNEGKTAQPFFTQRQQKLESGNALSIYGLSPEGVSRFRNIRMCEDICLDQKDQGLTDLSGAVLSYGMGLLGATAMLLSILA